MLLLDTANMQFFDVFSIMQFYLSQRELYYLLIYMFKCQNELNSTLLDACATLGVPRHALNIGTATRGVLAGCIRIAPPNSVALIDCEFVGTVRTC
jgi:DNA topoisomerase VI subunit A